MNSFLEEIERLVREQVKAEMEAQHAVLSESALNDVIQFKLDCIARNLVALGWPK